MMIRLDVGSAVCAKHVAHLVQAGGHGKPSLLNRVGEVSECKQFVEINLPPEVRVPSIHVHQEHPGQVQPVALKHVGLHGKIVKVDGLHARSGLHFKQPPHPMSHPFKHVRANQRPFKVKRSLKNGRHRRVGHECRGPFQGR